MNHQQSSIDIKEGVLLAPYTTFKIGGAARYFCVAGDQFDALSAYDFAKEKNLQTFVLGGGSNVLISDNGFNGLVIKIVNKGTEVVSENESSVLLKVASGEVWDEVVNFAVNNNWWGIENLSHIPGSTGAIAVQNVGAYGQEASNVIDSVTVFNKETHQILNLAPADCAFAYRQSIFNSSQKGKYIIFYIALRLSKDGQPNLTYRDLKNYFFVSSRPTTSASESERRDPLNIPDKRLRDSSDALGMTPGPRKPTLKEIRQAVIEIRDAKYPFPKQAKNGNAGSFFKNVVLDPETYSCVEKVIKNNFGNETLKKLREKVYKNNQTFKIPTAYLLDICGLKNIQVGGARINENQPLVIINSTGNATSKDVFGLVALVRQAVFEKTGLKLAHEPELVGFSTEELKEIES